MSSDYPHLQKMFPGYSPLFTSTGTCAIYLALKSIEKCHGLGEVIVPSTICPSVPLAVIQAGFSVRFCDVEQETFCLSLETIKPHVNAKTRAILVAYLFGKAIEIQDIIEYAVKYRIVIIEDIAQAIGGKINNSFLGSFGDMTVLSFNPKKIIGNTCSGCLLLKDREDFKTASTLERDLSAAPDVSTLSEMKTQFHDITMDYYERSRSKEYSFSPLSYLDLFQFYSPAFIYSSEHSIETKQKLDGELSKIEELRETRYNNYELYRMYLTCSIPIVQFTSEEMIWRLPIIVPSYKHQTRVISELRKAGYLVSDHYFPMSVFMGQKNCQNSEQIGLKAINLWVDHTVNNDIIIKSTQLVNSIVGK